MLDDMMRSYYAAYNAEDAVGLSSHLADDVVLTSAAGTQHGRHAYLATYRYMTDLFVDRMQPTHITVDANVATVRVSDSLTARSDIPDFMGQSLHQGQTLVLDLIGRYTFEGGKISIIEITPAAPNG